MTIQLPPAPEWHDDAACKDTPVAMFFPAAGEYPYEAIQLCCQCPVKAVCLTDALEQHEIHGVRGGRTAHERRAMQQGRIPAVPIGDQPRQLSESALLSRARRQHTARMRLLKGGAA